MFPRACNTQSTPKRGYVIGIPEWKWIVGTGVYVDDVDEAVKQAALKYCLISLTILCLVAMLAFLIARSINRSLCAIQDAVKRIEGELDFTVKAEVIGKDEISEVSMALNRLITTMHGNLNNIAEGSRSVAASASQMTTGSTQVSTAAQQQSQSASDMAATVEELTVSINHV